MRAKILSISDCTERVLTPNLSLVLYTDYVLEFEEPVLGIPTVSVQLPYVEGIRVGDWITITDPERLIGRLYG